MDIVNKIWSKYLGVNTTDAVLAKEAASEIESLRIDLADSQYMEQQMREAIQVAAEVHVLAYRVRNTAINALALPQDTSTLESMIAKAGEVMRERCIAILKDPAVCSSNFEFETWVRALPCVKLDDLK